MNRFNVIRLFLQVHVRDGSNPSPRPQRLSSFSFLVTYPMGRGCSKAPRPTLILVSGLHQPKRSKVTSRNSVGPRTDQCLCLAQVASGWGDVRSAPRAQPLQCLVHLPGETTGLGASRTTPGRPRCQETSPGLESSRTPVLENTCWLSDGTLMLFLIAAGEMVPFSAFWGAG